MTRSQTVSSFIRHIRRPLLVHHYVVIPCVCFCLRTYDKGLSKQCEGPDAILPCERPAHSRTSTHLERLYSLSDIWMYSHITFHLLTGRFLDFPQATSLHWLHSSPSQALGNPAVPWSNQPAQAFRCIRHDESSSDDLVLITFGLPERRPAGA